RKRIIFYSAHSQEIMNQIFYPVRTDISWNAPRGPRVWQDVERGRSRRSRRDRSWQTDVSPPEDASHERRPALRQDFLARGRARSFNPKNLVDYFLEFFGRMYPLWADPPIG